jgi:hypothetical protein
LEEGEELEEERTGWNRKWPVVEMVEEEESGGGGGGIAAAAPVLMTVRRGVGEATLVVSVTCWIGSSRRSPGLRLLAATAVRTAASGCWRECGQQASALCAGAAGKGDTKRA